MEKEQWKDEVLNSLQGIDRTEPNMFLFTRIEARLHQASGLSKLHVRLAGACMILLLVLNVWMVGTSTSNQTPNSNSLTATYRF